MTDLQKKKIVSILQKHKYLCVAENLKNDKKISDEDIATIYALFVHGEKSDVPVDKIDDPVLLKFYGFYHAINNSYEKTQLYWGKAIELNEHEVIAIAGKIYIAGDKKAGIEADVKKGRDLLLLGVALGNGCAMTALSNYYAKTDTGENSEKIFQLCQQSASINYPCGLMNLADTYCYGHDGVTVDEDKALSIYNEAYNKGNINAAIDILKIYNKRKDVHNTFKWAALVVEIDDLDEKTKSLLACLFEKVSLISK
jgi:TPR repeat protein